MAKSENKDVCMIQKLSDYIEKCVTPYHTVDAVKETLTKAGFTELQMNESWPKLTKGAGYFIDVFGSACVAFYVGEEFTSDGMLRIITAHTDSPCLKIKTSPEKKNADGSLSLNTEIYGGPILNTWLDRPLSIAGRVMLRTADAFAPKSVLVDLKKSVATIPNLAIHMNREVNKGVELNRQTDMLPYMGLVAMNGENMSEDYLLEVIAKNMQLKKEDILSYDLYVYNNDKPEICGIEDTLFSAPRIDNISSVAAGVDALVAAEHDKKVIQMLAIWDNEEVGSQTKQGGDSQTLSVILERIYLALSADREEYLNAVCKSIALSADVAHAQHPNHPEKSDITNHVYLNKGVVFKLSGTQKYATDAETLAIVKQLCEANNIPYQIFANRSDNPGGSTIGSLMSSNLPIRTVDVGIPMLAMHSARELAGVADQSAIYRLMKVFFE
ncbi:MAG: M18 family aminopeptidase [Lachnospiraceae bacterium]|nr:M18 family aminopeptidase [Lachnospiraceae bacterium]